MYEEMNVKYLIVKLKYSAYIKLQIALIFTCLVGAVLCYQFARGGDTWFFKTAGGYLSLPESWRLLNH